MIARCFRMGRYLRLVFAFALSSKSGDLGIAARLSVGIRVLRVFLRLRQESATTFPEQLLLLSSILSLDPDAPGHVAEFGCYKGASSVVLSIAAKKTGRKLLVFDSFEGLPEPTETVRNVTTGNVLDYRKGMYSGSLMHVRGNIERLGEIAAVEFVKGFYSDTLPQRPADERYAFIFEDADLVSSVKDVLIHSWPRLNPGGLFFSHEALDLEVCALFFDAEFWQTHHQCPPPGLVGVGAGLPLNRGGFPDTRMCPITGNYGSCLAYVFKTLSPP